ncbi:unnamed protein product [Paramecium sonneborni]|uniref:Uncharacterized protein n=1 Tax=Paramecium sonneborni TaxID=65129 RepID=A0A8S1RNM4_9CILI|nr:unnamed protein product [Paramecium sonneborni]
MLESTKYLKMSFHLFLKLLIPSVQHNKCLSIIVKDKSSHLPNINSQFQSNLTKGDAQEAI